MAKTSTKFTAQFTTKIGKTSVEFSIKLDLSDYGDDALPDDVVSEVMGSADEQLNEMCSSAKIKLVNLKDLKASHKAYVKAVKAANDLEDADATDK